MAVALQFLLTGASSKTSGPPPSFENVAYGPNSRNVLDFWEAESPNPTPVLICVHGGGFQAGNKSVYRHEAILAECLAHGISVASINYRYTTIAPFPAPMMDGARAIQFLRSKAGEWKIDPMRIGGTGESAGGNILVWVACQPDFADPKSADPVARESSRLAFVCGERTQTFNDPKLIRKYIYRGAEVNPVGLSFFGVKDPAEFKSERLAKLGYQASAINFVSHDSPALGVTDK